MPSPIQTQKHLALLNSEAISEDTTDVPFCYDAGGILGGQNAFNYIAFTLSLLTLIVNVSIFKETHAVVCHKGA